MHCDESDCELPFFPDYDTEYYNKHALKVVWFEADFSQSRYNFENQYCGSNACTIIAILMAAKCHFRSLKIRGPEKELNKCLILAFAHSILEGNDIHKSLKRGGSLHNINLTVPEAISFSGMSKLGLTEWVENNNHAKTQPHIDVLEAKWQQWYKKEWLVSLSVCLSPKEKSLLYMDSLYDTLHENITDAWMHWISSPLGRFHPDMYIILIFDSRSVLFVIQDASNTVTLIDSHQHSSAGAFIAVAYRPRIQLLCQWFSEMSEKLYNCQPEVYELSFLYFKSIDETSSTTSEDTYDI